MREVGRRADKWSVRGVFLPRDSGMFGALIGRTASASQSL